jgi:hypothetical protein
VLQSIARLNAKPSMAPIPSHGRGARAGGNSLAPGVSLPVGAILRLGDDQDGGLASCEPGSVEGLQRSR